MENTLQLYRTLFGNRAYVRPFNVRFLFIYGTFTAFVVTASLLAWRPNRLPFAFKAVALFLLVRAVFVALTHMAPSPIDPPTPAPFFNSIFYGSDLFFSGHTGLPFLVALAFWHIPQWRMFYLALTAFFGSIVLLGHYHYSIDVLAALFITHGVFQMSCCRSVSFLREPGCATAKAGNAQAV
jgi:PAP2 superfamily C-terminal